MDHTTKTVIEKLTNIADTNVDSIIKITETVNKLQDKVKQLENVIIGQEADINQLYHLVGARGEG